MNRAYAITLMFTPMLLMGQRTVITRAYGPFGTPGDAAYIAEGNRIYQACGAYESRGPCLYVIEDDRVYHAGDAFGRRGACAFMIEEDRIKRAQGDACRPGSCALIQENDKVFRSDGTFCNKQEGAFHIERGRGMAPTVVYLAEGPFAMRTDALFEVRGPLDPSLLLVILAGH